MPYESPEQLAAIAIKKLKPLKTINDDIEKIAEKRGIKNKKVIQQAKLMVWDHIASIING